MTVELRTNITHLTDRLNVTTGRMNNYANQSVDEVIQEESKQGNTEAVNYSRQLFGNADELINSFKLESPENKYRIINSMDSEQLNKLLPMLSEEDLVYGLNFFTQDKLLDMFNKVSPQEAVNVASDTFSLEGIVNMMPQDQLENFFFSENVEKNQVVKQLTKMPSEVLIQMAESMTGEPSDKTDAMSLISSISSLPDKQYKEAMANMDPTVQKQVVYQMAHDDKRVLENFDNTSYSNMLQKLQKPEIVKSMIGLQKESLQSMVSELPKDLFSIVATQIDTKELAKFLMSDCQNVLSNLGQT